MLRAVLVVARRELATQLRYRNKFLLDLTGQYLGLAPVVLTAVALGGGAAGGSQSYVRFVLLGFAAFSAIGLGSTILQYTGVVWSIESERWQGTLEHNFLTPLPRETFVLGAALYYALLYTWHVVSLLAAGWLLFGVDLRLTPASAAAAAGSVVAMLAMGVGLSTMAAGVLLLAGDTRLFELLLNRPLLLLSGAYFVLELLPEPFRSLAYLNPLAYGIDAFRASLTGSGVLLEPGSAVGVAGAAGLAMLVGGWGAYRWGLRRALRTGELGQY
jgi:ABC-2 type transport system permease protein